MRLFTRFAAVCFFAALAQPAVAQTFEDPASYNNAIVNEQVELLKKNLRYISKAAHSENARKIESRRHEVVEQNKVAVAKIQHMPAYKGNSDLRATSLNAYKTMLKVYTADYKQVNALATTRTQSFEAMERYFAAEEVAELMKQKDRLTKVDAQTINAHINTYNTQNQKFNEAYNRTAAVFMDTYVPVMND